MTPVVSFDFSLEAVLVTLMQTDWRRTTWIVSMGFSLQAALMALLLAVWRKTTRIVSMGFSLQAALVALLQTSRLQAHNYQSELVSANLLTAVLRFSFLIFHKTPKNYDRIRSSCVSPGELSDGRGGEGWGRTQIIRPRKSQVLYKLFSTLRSTQTSHPFKNWHLQRRHFVYHSSIFSLAGPHGPDAELLAEPRPHHLLQPERRQRGVLPRLPRLGDAQQERLHYYWTVLLHNGAAT